MMISRIRLAFVLASVAAPAVLPGIAMAACVPATTAATEALSRFASSPQRLLSENATGASLVSSVRGLAAANPGIASSIVQQGQGASDAQAGAIGTGLAQAAAVCIRTDSVAALAIQDAVLTSNNAALIQAYRAAAGDVRTAAIAGGGGAGGGGAGGGAGGGGGGGAGGGGGLGGSGVSTSPTFTTQSRATPGAPTNASFGNNGFNFSGGSGSTISTAARAVAASVSPSR